MTNCCARCCSTKRALTLKLSKDPRISKTAELTDTSWRAISTKWKASKTVMEKLQQAWKEVTVVEGGPTSRWKHIASVQTVRQSVKMVLVLANIIKCCKNEYFEIIMDVGIHRVLMSIFPKQNRRKHACIKSRALQKWFVLPIVPRQSLDSVQIVPFSEEVCFKRFHIADLNLCVCTPMSKHLEPIIVSLCFWLFSHKHDCSYVFGSHLRFPLSAEDVRPSLTKCVWKVSRLLTSAFVFVHQCLSNKHSPQTHPCACGYSRIWLFIHSQKPSPLTRRSEFEGLTTKCEGRAQMYPLPF